jgi:hypothetical protein
LNQNTQAIAATIQALEVQRMTLNTLQGMNLSMGDLAQSLKIKPEAWPNAAAAFTAKPHTAQATAPKPAAKTKKTAKAAGPSAAPAVDPMQWWGALTQQFQDIAQKTMSDMQQQAKAAGMDGAAVPNTPNTPKAAAKSAPAAKTPARKRRSSPRA